MMLDILGAILTIVATLLPTVLAARAARKPVKERERIDAILVVGTDVAVATELSQLFDAAGGAVGQSTNALPGAGAEPVSAANH
jgi:hypothetical protein